MNNIETIKTMDLASYAEGIGYERVQAKCSPNSLMLRRQEEKIVITRKADGHYVYSSVHDSQDSGSIVDFVMTRRRCGYAEAMTHLLGHAPFSSPTGFKASPSLPPVADEPDRKRIAAVWNAATWNPEPAYLLGRGLSPDVLKDPRFHDRFRVNKRGVVMFPHFDRQGMTGYELRGEGVKSFAKDGKRALWYSNNLKQARTIMICESAINAISHAELHGGDCAYVSHAGTISSKQRDLLAGLFTKIDQKNGRAIVGTDNDEAGERYFEQMQALTGMKLDRLSPILADWNADLLYIRREQA